MDADTQARLEQLLDEEDHVIQFGEDGWIIAHPLRERLDGSLFDCEARWDADDPGIRGRFRFVQVDGEYVIGGRYEEDHAD